MSLVPMSPSVEDIFLERQNRVATYLGLRGDPAGLVTFSVTLCSAPPSSEQPQQQQQQQQEEEERDRRPAAAACEQVLGVRWSRRQLRDAVAHAYEVPTEASFLQLACLFERRSVVTQLFDMSQKTVRLAPSAKSLLPSPLFLAVMSKSKSSLAAGGGTAVPSTCSVHLKSSSSDEEGHYHEHAISFGSLPIVEALLTRGVNPDGLHEESPRDLFLCVTPLHLALLQDNQPIAHAMLQAGAQIWPELRGLLLTTALTCSIGGLLLMRRRHEALVDRWISQPVDENGKTMLHYATATALQPEYLFNTSAGDDMEERRENFCRVILALGCPLDDQELDGGDTALHMAWKLGRCRLARMLVEEYQAKAWLPNRQGLCAFQSHGVSRNPFHLVVRCSFDIIQERGPLSPVGYLHFLMSMCEQGVEGDIAAADATWMTETCARDGMHVMHAICCDEVFMRATEPDTLYGLIARLIKTITTAAFASNVEEAFSLWMNTPDRVAQRSPLQHALLLGAPLSLIQLLVQQGGCDPLFVCGPSNSHWNSFQLLASLADPYSHIGDVALFLLQSLGDRIEINDVPTHPFDSMCSMLDDPVVQHHAHWQRFFEILRPPMHEKERRLREGKRFEAFYRGEAAEIVSEIEPDAMNRIGRIVLQKQQPHLTTSGGDPQFHVETTPLARQTDDQGAYVTVIRPEPQPSFSSTTTTTAVEPPPPFTDRAQIVRDASLPLPTKLATLMTHHELSQLSSRNIFQESNIITTSEVPREKYIPPLCSVQRWMDALGSGNGSSDSGALLLQSWLIERVRSWVEDTRRRLHASTVWDEAQRQLHARRLARKRHGEFHLVENRAAYVLSREGANASSQL